MLLFVLPKIHKNVWPDPEIPSGHPIVSDVDSVSRPYASFLEHFLAPSYLRETNQLLILLLDVNLENCISIIDVVNVIRARRFSNLFCRFSPTQRPQTVRLNISPKFRLLLTQKARSLQIRKTAIPSNAAYSYGRYFSSSLAICMTHLEANIHFRHLGPLIKLRHLNDIDRNMTTTTPRPSLQSFPRPQSLQIWTFHRQQYRL